MDGVTVADRIVKRMRELNVTQADIRRGTKAGKATISSWINGATEPSGMYASKLASFLQCDTDWLLTGIRSKNGDLFKNELVPKDTELAERTIKGYVRVISWTDAAVLDDINFNEVNKEYKLVPKPSYLSSSAFALKVNSQIMSPYFDVDDIIYIDTDVKTSDIADGNFVIVKHNSYKEALFKRVVIGDTMADMYLVSTNSITPNQQPLKLSDCELIGIVDSKSVRFR